MRVSEPEVVIDDLYFPECLRWRDERLWFSDMLAGEVRSATGVAGSGSNCMLALSGDECGGLGWLPDGDLLLVGMKSRRILRSGTAGGELTVHADLSEQFAYPLNDMVVDPSGRAYVGGYGFDADSGACAQSVQLALIEPSGQHRLVGSPLVFPNGMQLRDGKELLVSETFADQLSVLAIGPDGSLGSARTIASFANGDGPDGICCDDTGGTWVACAYGQRLVHVNEAGEIDHEIDIPDRGVCDCLLGGPDRRTLYFAVANTDEEYAAVHRTGSILAVRVDP